jgi:guanine deaminase
MPAHAIRGRLVWFTGDPFLESDGAARAFHHEPDGVVSIDSGRIVDVGAAADVLPRLAQDCRIDRYPGCVISAGFIDTHVHYAQTGIIAAHGAVASGTRGAQLLDWLNHYAFPAEAELRDRAKAERMAHAFCDELIRNGTTTALVFGTVFPDSVDALFEEAARRNLRLIAGKVLMDRNAPAGLLDTPQSSYDDSKALIRKWHGRGRASYAITPRFAPTSSPEQLELAGALWAEHPDVYVHSHVTENAAECAWVRELFPDEEKYIDVYEAFGLTGRRAVYAHGVHLDEDALTLCHHTGTALAHCPTSNLFLGSGLFNLGAATRADRRVRVGLGTDVGAGTSFSMLATLNEAYKVAQLTGSSLDGVRGWYLATRGAADALDLLGTIGSLEPGCEADIIVIDPAATPLLALRSERCQSIEELLFVLMTLGDDRAIRTRYIAGVVHGPSSTVHGPLRS